MNNLLIPPTFRPSGLKADPPVHGLRVIIYRVDTSGGTRIGAIAGAMIAAMAASCGSPAPTAPAVGAGHTVISTVMLEATGPNPREITIGPGEFVSFMNHESVPYAVTGGAGPSQPDCPEINAVGLLGPGEIRSTAPFPAAKTCDYHVPRGQAVLFSGRIIIR